MFEAVLWPRRTHAETRLSLKADGAALVAGGTEAWAPREALDGGLARVTARGAGVEGSATLSAGADGTVLNIR